MLFIIRADGNSRIGMGHITRCIALADELKKYGDVEFISRKLPVKIPFKVHKLVADGYDDDIKFTRSVLRRLSPDVVIVDHHDLGQDYLDSISAFTDLLVTIDDLKRGICSDIVVNVNLFSLKMKYACKGGKILLGPKYALIKKINPRKYVRPEAKKILVSMGGADVLNLTPKVIEALKCVDNIHVTVVIGPAFENEKDILEAVSNDGKFTIRRTNDLPELMIENDLAVCGGGTTLYEIAATGTPAIIVCQAENQIINARELDGKTLINLGMGSNADKNKIVSSVESLLGDYEARRKLCANGRKLVDCRGAERVRNIIVRELNSRKISLIPAKMDDAAAVWKWRNEKTTRAYSFNTAYIPLGEHKEWFAEAIKDKTRKLFVVTYGRKKIGFVRIDFEAGPEMNIALDKRYRKLGIGPRVIRIACGLAGKSVVARIKAENTASIKAFGRAGFVISKENGAVEMRLAPHTR